MGYDLHITRKQYWCDETGPDISLDEWLGYVQGDAEIAPDPANPGDENWLIVLERESWPLWWRATGELYTKNPGDAIVQKLIAIADALNARVIGDDDEIYRGDGSGAISVERR
jgi:hypothetical protein